MADDAIPSLTVLETRSLQSRCQPRQVAGDAALESLQWREGAEVVTALKSQGQRVPSHEGLFRRRRVSVKPRVTKHNPGLASNQ